MGTTINEDECADLVRRKEENANGSTWEGGTCYAQFGATGINRNDKRRTCLFKGQLGILVFEAVFS